MNNPLTQDSIIKEKPSSKGERLFTIQVKAEAFAQLYKSKLQERAATITLKGFRKGKAPFSHIEKELGGRMREDTIRLILDAHVRSLIEDHDIHFIHTPQAEMKSMKEGGDISFSVTFFLFPDIADPSWKDIIIERDKYEIGDKDIEDALRRIAETKRSFKSSGKKAVLGNRIVMDFEATIKGKAFEGGTAKNATVTLGEEESIKGLQKCLENAAKGDELSLRAVLPDFFGDEVKGKKADFAITVKDVMAAPEIIINDATAKEWGCENLMDLKDKVKKSLQNEAVRVAEQKVASMFIEKFSKILDFPVSAQFVRKEAESTLKEGDEPKTVTKEMMEQASRRLRLTMAVSQLADRHDIAVEDKDIDHALRMEASRYGERAEQVFSQLSKDSSVRQRMQYALLEGQFCEMALKKVTIKDMKRDFSQLYAPPKN